MKKSLSVAKIKLQKSFSLKKLKSQAPLISAFLAIAVAALIAVNILLRSSYTRYETEANAKAQEKAQFVSSKVTGFMATASQIAGTLKAFVEGYPGKDRLVPESYLNTMLTSAPKDLVYGVGLWYEPFTFEPGNQYFGPYVHRDDTAQTKMKLTYEWTTKEYNFHAQDYYTLSLKANGQPIFTEPYVDGGITYMTVGVSFQNPSNTRAAGGTISVDMILPQLDKLISEVNQNSSESIFIASAKDSILAHPRSKLLIDSETSKLTKEGKKAEGLTILSVKSESAFSEFAEVLTYKAKIPDNGWYVYVVSDKTVAMQMYYSYRQSAMIALAIFYAALLGLFFLINFFTSRIAQIRAKSLAEIMRSQEKTQNLLDNITQGVVTVEKDLTFGELASAYVKEVLGKGPADISGKSLVTELFSMAVNLTQQQIDIAIDILEGSFGEDDLTYETNVAHLPSRLEIKPLNKSENRFVDIEWVPMWDENKLLKQVMVVLRDVTENLKLELKAKRAGQATARLTALATCIGAKSKEALERFLKESKSRVVALDELFRSENLEDLFKELHTLKGGARLMGITDLSNAAHDAETCLAIFRADKSKGSADLAEKLNRLISEFDAYLSVATQTLGISFDVRVSVVKRGLSEMVARNTDAAAGICETSDLVLESINISEPNVNWRSDVLDSFSSVMVHVFTNAVDHGYRLPIAQGRLDKKPIRLSIEGKVEGAHLHVKFKDEGAGYDAKILGGLAKDRGFVPSKNETVLDVIFMNGLSTAGTVSDTSGRGVGLAAVKQYVEAIGGSINAKSEGPGACIHIVLPLSAIK